METFLLQAADIFFIIFHTVFVLFNMFGWIKKSWRRYHLMALGATLFSWFILGIWFGWGYCFCTDWHWDVRDKLGYVRETNSYISFLIIKLTGLKLPRSFVDTLAMVVLTLSIITSVVLNVRDRRRT